MTRSMPVTTRNIGLSLGADICWPACYEDILSDLKPEVKLGKEVIRFACERVRIGPYSLRERCKYDLVIDRLTHWYAPTREWIKKSVLMDGLYVYNNPWSVQSNEKHSSYAAMMALGMPIPDTAMVPPKSYEPKPDLDYTLKAYANLFDLGQAVEGMTYPLFMKPYDGGGWNAVTKCDDEKELREAYESSGRHLMHVQAAVSGYDSFVRAVGLGPQVRLIQYDPSQPLHGRYVASKDFASKDDQQVLTDICLTINAFFGWDFNSCESLRKDGTWYPIDYANPCPDSQVNSIHYHFPWYVRAHVRWSLFVAATKRGMRKNLDFEPFYKVAAKDMSWRDKLREYGRISRERFDADRFEEFCAKHLANLDEVVWNYFATDRARDAVRRKVANIYPAHEVDEFTEMFWQKIQHWRRDEARAGATA